MSSIATKVVFPAPPPTTNELSARERTQLVRKTKKIEQLLGATPHLVDGSADPFDIAGPIHISLVPGSPTRRLTRTKTRRASIDSASSDSSSSSLGTPLRRSCSTTSNVSISSSRKYSHSVRCSSPTMSVVQRDETWPRNSKVPLLRLAMESRTLDSIPASPPPTRTSFLEPISRVLESPTSTSSSSDESLDSPLPLPSHTADSPRNSLVLETQFIIPTQSSLRKQKMDRLRKKLGAGVPLELVFPNDDTDEKLQKSPLSVTRPSASNRDKECPPLPVPSPRTKKGPRIAHARDSIVDAASIHRAKRQTSSGKNTSAAQPKKALPSPPIPSPVGFKRAKQRLSLIVESPDEHASADSGIRISRLDLADLVMRDSTSTSAERTAEWVSLSAEVKLWSAMMGYEGWDVVSSNSNSVVQTRESGSVSATGTRKQRPTSYRKPVPAILVDESP